MMRRYVAIDGKVFFAVGAEPNLMVALALPYELAVTGSENLLKFASEVPGH